MTKIDKIRIGVVGIGGMGSNHARYLSEGKVDGARLVAVADINPAHLDKARAKFGKDLAVFASHGEMLAAQVVDAVLIATPHYDHPGIAIDAFNAGVHVLTEKPAGVYTKQVREMNDAAKQSGKVFGIMYNQRTRGAHKAMRDIVQSGRLGEIRRVLYQITNWYRTQYYYDRGQWRATWAGEGGGVLINQCPHNLDVWQWVCGMPKKVTTHMGFGRYHDIEVEDDVTAVVEYENGATGVFITTTGEAPGVERFEIAGDNGLLSMSNGKLTWQQTQKPISEDLVTSQEGFKKPETWTIDIPCGESGGHRQITQDFVDAIRNGENGATLIAPGEEGIHGLMLSNAMHMSAWKQAPVTLPIDEDEYHTMLQERASSSRYKKPVQEAGIMDVAGSF